MCLVWIFIAVIAQMLIAALLSESRVTQIIGI